MVKYSLFSAGQTRRCGRDRPPAPAALDEPRVLSSCWCIFTLSIPPLLRNCFIHEKGEIPGLPSYCSRGRRMDFPLCEPARFTNFSRLAVEQLICRTAIEGRQQRNEGIASQFPSVANKINQALWKNEELYLQSASFYLLRNKQG